MPSLLIVDDEPNVIASLLGALRREGYAVEGATSLAEGRARLREAYDLVLLDVRLEDGSGLELLSEITAAAPETVVIMMSGHATIDVAVRATKLGAFDFLEKPVDLERLLILLGRARATRSLEAENLRLKESWASPIVGRSPAVARLVEEIRRAGASEARVLIRGEHGTGKELVARALHLAGPRASRAFVAVNCAAIPEDLFESEVFGHEKGAFTGATQARRGRFEDAEGGTLFLDEVGDLSPRAQTKLLRVLQEGELSRVGGSRVIRVDVRVVAATNRDLEAAAKTQAFREDLYYRLAVIPIAVPPLRERAEDIPILTRHFAAQVCREMKRPAAVFEDDALRRIARHPFPGNVRELRNLIERLLIMNSGTIGVEQVNAVLPVAEVETPGNERLADAVRAFEKRRIEDALRAEGGNVTRAAARLGLERSHLYKKMKQLEAG